MLVLSRMLGEEAGGVGGVVSVSRLRFGVGWEEDGIVEDGEEDGSEGAILGGSSGDIYGRGMTEGRCWRLFWGWSKRSVNLDGTRK